MHDEFVANQNKNRTLLRGKTNVAAPSNGMTTCALYTNGIFPIRNLDRRDRSTGVKFSGTDLY
jgi:hypothetical protein